MAFFILQTRVLRELWLSPNSEPQDRPATKSSKCQVRAKQHKEGKDHKQPNQLFSCHYFFFTINADGWVRGPSSAQMHTLPSHHRSFSSRSSFFTRNLSIFKSGYSVLLGGFPNGYTRNPGAGDSLGVLFTPMSYSFCYPQTLAQSTLSINVCCTNDVSSAQLLFRLQAMNDF